MGKPVFLDCAQAQVGPNGVVDYHWPVARSEILAVRDVTVQGLVGLVRQLQAEGRGEAAEILLVLIFIINTEIMSLYQAWGVVRRSREAGRELILPQNERLFSALYEGSVPASPPMLRELLSGPFRPRKLRLPLRVARGWLMRFVDSISRYPLLGVDYNRDIVTMTLSPLIQSHAEKCGERVVYRGPHTWFGPVNAPVADQEDDERVVEDVVALTERAFTEGGESLPTIIIEHQRRWLHQALGAVRFHLRHLEVNMEKVPRRLWTGAGMQIWSRMLRVAVMRNGGEVTGHDHGTGAGHRSDRYKTLREFEHCSRFVTFAPGQAEGNRHNIDKSLLIQKTAPVIDWIPLPQSAPSMRVASRSSAQGRLSAQQVKRILFVSGLADEASLFFSPTLPRVGMMDWYARLMSQLRKWGYEVYWKPHPSERALPPGNYLDSIGVHLVEGVVEEWYEKADALLFDTFHTTAFISGVSSGRPMVLVDFGVDALSETARALLERRVAIVEANYARDTYRAGLEWEHLHTALRDDCLRLSDPAFRHAYITAE